MRAAGHLHVGFNRRHRCRPSGVWQVSPTPGPAPVFVTARTVRLVISSPVCRSINFGAIEVSVWRDSGVTDDPSSTGISLSAGPLH